MVTSSYRIHDFQSPYPLQIREFHGLHGSSQTEANEDQDVQGRSEVELSPPPQHHLVELDFPLEGYKELNWSLRA